MPVPLADDHWHHHEYYTSRNWFKTKAENIRPWTQPYFQTINVYTPLRASKVESWVQHKMGIKSWVNSATGIFNDWTQSETESIILGNVPKNKAIRPSFQMEASTNHIWFQLISNTIRVLPQAESQVISFLTQSISDILLSQSEKELETYLFMSDNNAVSSWLSIQNSLRQRNKLEPETVTPWIQQKWHITHPWNRLETKVLKTGYNFEADTSQTLLTYSKSDEIKLRTQLESPLVRRWPEDAIVTLWPLTKSDVIMPWSQLEYKTTQYLAQPNFDRINPWIQHKVSTETLEINPWTHSDIVLSHSLHTQIDYTPWPLTYTDAIRLWSQVEYEPTQSLAQTNVGLINAWIHHKDCIETLDINSCIYSHRLISYLLQPQIHSFTLWSQLQSMTAQTWNPTVEQVVKTQALTAVVTVSPSFQVQGTLLRDEPILVSPSKSVPQDKHSLEPLSLRPSKLNVSLAECHLSMIWKDNLQTLWIYKTAVVSHETTECGLRPGLVPYCPNCWEAEIGEFPWMVSVQLSYSHFCAGSILNEKWILTSARCANFIKRSESLASVQVGLLDLQDPTQGETVGIHRSMPYIGPRGPLGPGLIFLKEPLHFQPLVLPICLEESQEQETHIQLYDCWLPSWSLMRGSPGILQKRHLSIMQVSTCAKFWPQLNDFTFCVEAKKAMGESGCKGDLGAPLVCHLKQKDTWVQVGILIHFDEHCKKPYVFSEVSPFVFWLQRVTHPSHAPWSFQRPVTTSLFNSLSISTHRRAPIFSSPTAVIHPHFISLPHPQALADHISLQYTMPWQAMIFSCGNQICSGSVISSYWVLTAAHCVRNMNPEDTVVILGLRHPGTPLRVVKVTAILLHERFRLVSQTARNDLALVLLQEVQSSIHIVAPLGNVKNLNTSECWLSGPQILKQGDILENPEMLQIQVMGASNCAYLYPDIGSSTVCYIAQARGPEINMESVSPGSAVMCRPLSGNGKWTQIGFTSLKHLATIVSPHISWILSSSAKAGYPLNHVLTPWVENPNSSGFVKYPDLLLLSIVMAIALKKVFIL
nr:TPA_inf: PRSSLY [Peromyscus eremicus]